MANENNVRHLPVCLLTINPNDDDFDQDFSKLDENIKGLVILLLIISIEIIYLGFVLAWYLHPEQINSSNSLLVR
jgi:hypothetical protein